MAALFERTVVGVDGSKLAESSLEVVGPIARAQSGELTLVMVMDGHVDQALQGFARAEGIAVVEAAETYLTGLVASLAERGVQATYRLVFDPDAATGILEAAESANASALVVASHGRTGIGRWVLGSVAQKIVQGADMPTLVIPVRQ